MWHPGEGRNLEGPNRAGGSKCSLASEGNVGRTEGDSRRFRSSKMDFQKVFRRFWDGFPEVPSWGSAVLKEAPWNVGGSGIGTRRV